jgi:hypothetical protein
MLPTRRCEKCTNDLVRSLAGFVVLHAYKVYRINQSLLLPYPWDGTRACLAVSLK